MICGLYSCFFLFYIDQARYALLANTLIFKARHCRFDTQIVLGESFRYSFIDLENILLHHLIAFRAVSLGHITCVSRSVTGKSCVRAMQGVALKEFGELFLLNLNEFDALKLTFILSWIRCIMEHLRDTMLLRESLIECSLSEIIKHGRIDAVFKYFLLRLFLRYEVKKIPAELG